MDKKGMAPEAPIANADRGQWPFSSIMQNRRTGPRDRRTLHTYLAKDRRSGIADRRKQRAVNHFPWHQVLKQEVKISSQRQLKEPPAI